MPEKQNTIRGELTRRDKKCLDLANEIGMTYNKVNRILGGYDNKPSGFDFAVMKAIKKWDQEHIDLIAFQKELRKKRGNGGSDPIDADEKILSDQQIFPEE